jgi:hypothetical protein
VRWVLVLLVLSVFLAERARLGLSFPVPWADEGSFLFPALGFRDHWSFFAPEINPERHVMWMPPGFMVIQGLVFKVVHFSLDRARSLSALWLACAFACVAGIFRKYRTAAALPLLFLVFLLSPIFHVVGNTARMEALVLFISSAAFLLMSEGRAVGIALLVAGPLVHPNAIFPAVVGIPYFLFLRRNLGRPTRVEWAAFGAAALSWALYGLYVARHFPGFREDMINQLRFKTLITLEDGGPFVRMFFAPVLGPALALAGAAVVGRRFSAPTGPILALGAAFVLQTMIASGWLYEVYIGFGTLLAAIVVIETAAVGLEKSALSAASRRACVALAFLVTGAVAFVAARSSFEERSLTRAVVRRPGVQPPYYTMEDVDHVGQYLQKLSRERGDISIQFIPDGEGLVFEGIRSPALRFVQQTFYIGGFNVAVIHDSVWVPGYVHDLEYLNVSSLHHFVPPKVTLLRLRDESERWTILEWDDMSPSGEIQP